MSNRGMTLIEVLIALAILSIALTAIMKTAGQNIRDTSYLADKTSAHWVAQSILNQARLRLLTVSASEPLQNHMQMLGKDWYWRLTAKPSPNARIEILDITVSRNETDPSLVTLKSYRNEP